MGHESGDVALAVADSSDIANGAVGIAGAVVGTVGSCVAKNDLAIFLEVGEGGFVTVVIAIGVRDGDLEDLALLRGVGERSVRLLDADVHVAADEAQAAIAHHRAGEQARFAQNLEAVADAEYHSAAVREFFDGLHHRGKTRDGAGAQIIAVGKSAGQNNGVAIRQIFGLVPDEFDGLPQNVADGVKRVMVAIGPGENDDSKFHAVAAPCSIAGTSILAHTREFGLERAKQEIKIAQRRRAHGEIAGQRKTPPQKTASTWTCQRSPVSFLRRDTSGGSVAETGRPHLNRLEPLYPAARAGSSIARATREWIERLQA